MSTSTKKKDAGLHNSLVYIVQHWQLYVFFLLPALALTIIFRYIPMGGILIAFEKYNPIRGILGKIGVDVVCGHNLMICILCAAQHEAAQLLCKLRQNIQMLIN